jgi:hypothetical protein
MHTFNRYSYNNSQLVLLGGCVGSSELKKRYNYGDAAGMKLTTRAHCEKVRVTAVVVACSTVAGVWRRRVEQRREQARSHCPAAQHLLPQRHHRLLLRTRVVVFEQ